MKIFSRYFIRGTIVLLPLAATLYVFYTLFNLIDRIGHKILSFWIPEGSILTGIGFLLTAALIVIVGYASSNWFGASLVSTLDDWMMEAPLTKGIYGAIRETIASISGKSAAFDKVVAVKFPELGLQRVGFVTQEEVKFLDGGEPQVMVYFPHSFQVSGNMLVIPKKNVRYLDMTKEAAIKMIMSGGIIAGGTNKGNPT